MTGSSISQKCSVYSFDVLGGNVNDAPLYVVRINSGCQLAAFWVTGGTNPQGFGSVAPKQYQKKDKTVII